MPFESLAFSTWKFVEKFVADREEKQSCLSFQLERNAFLQTLSRFTLLTVTSQVTDIKAKNVACLRTLLTIGQTDGNYLGASWYDVSSLTRHEIHRNEIVELRTSDSQMY